MCDLLSDLIAALDAFEAGECLIRIERDRAKTIVTVVSSVCIQIEDEIVRIQSLLDQSVEPSVTTEDDIVRVSVGDFFDRIKNRSFILGEELQDTQTLMMVGEIFEYEGDDVVGEFLLTEQCRKRIIVDMLLRFGKTDIMIAMTAEDVFDHFELLSCMSGDDDGFGSYRS
ncbi:MAG: hypothetical protein H6766_04245 [Candidatus Peribacteria bacterium]|nr:MAG: hypothetical protein H6766_04245 [Candidatus Peribacteria bacterium]